MKMEEDCGWLYGDKWWNPNTKKNEIEHLCYFTGVKENRIARILSRGIAPKRSLA